MWRLSVVSSRWNVDGTVEATVHHARCAGWRHHRSERCQVIRGDLWWWRSKWPPGKFEVSLCPES